MSTIFYNGSNYYYYFIIKDLAEELKTNLTCFGKKNRKILNLSSSSRKRTYKN